MHHCLTSTSLHSRSLAVGSNFGASSSSDDDFDEDQNGTETKKPQANIKVKRGAAKSKSSSAVPAEAATQRPTGPEPPRTPERQLAPIDPALDDDVSVGPVVVTPTSTSPLKGAHTLSLVTISAINTC